MNVRDQNFPSSSRKSLIHRGEHCLNCGTPLDISDRFCHYCGQRNSTKRLSLRDYFGEFMLSIVTYDSRFWYTVKDLICKPGIITRDYIFGKRLHYANPFRFFLSVSIIYFLLSGFLDYMQQDIFNLDSADWAPFQLKMGPENEENGEINGISAVMDTLFKQQQEKNDAQKTYSYISKEDLDTLTPGEQRFKKIALFRDFYVVTGIKDASKALDSLNYPKSRFNTWLYSRNRIIDRVKENPSAFISFLASKIPFFLFFFIPVFAVFFLLIYFRWYPFSVIQYKVKRYNNSKTWIFLMKIPVLSTLLKYAAFVFYWIFQVKRRVNYMEHMVFIFHFFTFLFLGLLLCLIPDYFLGSGILAAIFMVFAAPFYFYKALRNFYGESRMLTIFKFFLLNLIFFTVGSFTGAVFFLGTATIY
ncbi:MAG TPA: DUF3667 domain-containing protein [Leeuwenhoekiella sp.]|nr:DUF3667 domain-containing protein [Leeuwenhoekiella sp.]